jgi:uncharacterized membrane protein SpoIIM required for sporulation
VIVDLDRFVAQERPHWQALEEALRPYDQDRLFRPSVEQSMRLFELYQRSVADLARLEEASHSDLAGQLSALVGRAYAQIHSSRRKPRFRPVYWLMVTLPCTFRKQIRPFQLALLVTLIGCAIGGVLLKVDPNAKATLLPFEQLLGDPKDRVKQEEKDAAQKHPDQHASFAAMLMTHNAQVAFFSTACGMTWGLGTIILLFYNGVVLGAVSFDYVQAGQAKFLLGWLLPHGVIEIPAILVASQAGLVLASALIGWNSRIRRADRLRSVTSDVLTLAGGAGLMLVWAGLIESYISQYHEPVLPYAAKIAFGLVELAVLIAFYALAGRRKKTGEIPNA